MGSKGQTAKSKARNDYDVVSPNLTARRKNLLEWNEYHAVSTAVMPCFLRALLPPIRRTNHSTSIGQDDGIIKPARLEMFLFHLIVKVGCLLEVLRGATNGKDNSNLLHGEGCLNRFDCRR